MEVDVDSETVTRDVASDLGVESEGWEAFKLEHRGIDYVPAEDRHTTPSRLFWTWSGATLNVIVFVYGSLLISVFGLSLVQAIVLTILGVFGGYTMLGVFSLAGPEAGTGQMVVSRAAFGLNWNRLNAFCNWLLCLGYEVANLSIIVLAGLAILSKAGVGPSTGVKVVVIIIAVAIQLPLPLYGHATVLKVLRPLAILLAIFFIIMAILVEPKIHASLLHQHAGIGALSLALAVTLSGGGLGWIEFGSDYSRYVPRSTSKKKIFWAVTLGATIPSTLVMILGEAVTSTLPSATSEISGLPKIFPGWFVVPYLILAIVSIYAVNTVVLYSSGLSMQAYGVKVKRWLAVCIDLGICTVLTFLVILNGHFNTLLSEFLLFSLAWISPWFAIVLTDQVVRRNRYDPPSLFKVGSGIYWRGNGINTPAVIAQVIGTVCCFLWLNAYPAYVGPIASRVGGPSGSDFNIFFGGGVAAIIYWVIAHRRIREERENVPQYVPDHS
jgi:purine-cytosine permease-like protein